jgi:uncharacterized protein YjgD (DUF1641 family)
MGDMEDERSMLDALDPGQHEAVSPEEERSIVAEINHIRQHLEVLEDAARAARAVEFDQIRLVVEQLEAVAAAARAVESDLTRELANTNRMSVATARIVRDRLATALRTLAEALETAEASDRKKSLKARP